MKRSYGRKLIYLLFIACFVHTAYSMRNCIVEIYGRYESNDFVRTFPYVTLSQARMKYNNCSHIAQHQVWSTIQEKYETDKIFSVVYDMATKLPLEASTIIVSKLLHNNKQAVEKFLQMPIGKALEWHAVVERASRGEVILLPVFIPVRQDFFNALEREPEDLNVLPEGFQLFSIVSNDKVGIVLNEAREAISVLDDGTSRVGKKSTISVALFAPYLEAIKSQLFQLTMQDIIFLLHSKKESCYTRRALEQLVAIDKKIPFLSDGNGTIEYTFRKAYSLVNIGNFMKKRIKKPMIQIFSFFELPFFCAAMSKYIQKNFCQKTISKDVMQALMRENERRLLLNKVLKDFGNKGLIKYCKSLLNITEYMEYNWRDTIKMNVPILLMGPIIGLIDYHYYHNKRDALVTFCFLGIPCMMLSSFASQCFGRKGLTLLMSGLACASIMFDYTYSNYNNSFRYQEGDVKFCDVPKLLKRTDITIL